MAVQRSQAIKRKKAAHLAARIAYTETDFSLAIVYKHNQTSKIAPSCFKLITVELLYYK